MWVVKGERSVARPRPLGFLSLIPLLVAAAVLGGGLRAAVHGGGPLQGHVIAVDAGHGGYDPGAIDPRGLREKDLTLDLAHRLAGLLRAAGARVIMTRESDADFVNWSLSGARARKLSDLDFRIEIAGRGRAQILVSIHANKALSTAYSGAEVFYEPESADGRYLAELIQAELRAATVTERVAKPASYYLTRNAPMPAVIVEVGYLSNPREAELLRDPGHRQKLAKSIAEGINAYFAASSP